MTVIEYVEEIKLRLRAFEVATEFDDLQLLSYLNTSRKKVQYETMTKYPERYAVVSNIDFDPAATAYLPYSIDTAVNVDFFGIDFYEIQLPINFLDAFVVKLKYTADENQYEYEARRMTKMEMFNISQHRFNKPTYSSPVYSIERKNGNYYLYFSALKDGADYITATPTLEIWHTAVIADLEWMSGATLIDGDADKVIARELEELVILYAIFLYLQQIYDQNALNLIGMEIQGMLQTLQPLYELNKLETEVQIASQEVS